MMVGSGPIPAPSGGSRDDRSSPQPRGPTRCRQAAPIEAWLDAGERAFATFWASGTAKASYVASELAWVLSLLAASRADANGALVAGRTGPGRAATDQRGGPLLRRHGPQ